MKTNEAESGRRKVLLGAVAGLALAVGAAGFSGAHDGRDDGRDVGRDDGRKERKVREQEAVRSALQRGEVLPLARILEIASAEVPGDVIEVELERDHGRIVYEIKVLTAKGRVRELRLDARTGAVLNIEDD